MAQPKPRWVEREREREGETERERDRCFCIMRAKKSPFVYLFPASAKNTQIYAGSNPYPHLIYLEITPIYAENVSLMHKTKTEQKHSHLGRIKYYPSARKIFPSMQKTLPSRQKTLPFMPKSIPSINNNNNNNK